MIIYCSAFLLLEERVLVHCASVVMGVEGLQQLATEYMASASHFAAAKAKFSIADLSTGNTRFSAGVLKESLESLDQIDDSEKTREIYQLEWAVVSQLGWQIQIQDQWSVGTFRLISAIASAMLSSSPCKSICQLRRTYLPCA